MCRIQRCSLWRGCLRNGGIHFQVWTACHCAVRRGLMHVLWLQLWSACLWADEEWLGGELRVLWCGRMGRIWGRMDRVHGWVLGVAVHPLRNLGRLPVQAASMLIVGGRRGDGRRRVGLRRVVDGGVRALHLCGCHKIGCFWTLSVFTS